ncbi:MAG: thiamine phosphate synthase [Halanaerobiales bacterium]
MLNNYLLYLVTDNKIIGKKDLLISIEEAIKGGITIVQLREKNSSTLDFYNLARKIKKLTTKYNIPFIINDRIDIALAVDADGVHLGVEDMPIHVARKILGKNKIIGASANCVDEALNFQEESVNYLGVGALFPTSTKKNVEKVTLNELKNIKKAVKIPIVGIGGINEKNATDVINAGADGIAVVSSILSKDNVHYATKKMLKLIT